LNKKLEESYTQLNLTFNLNFLKTVILLSGIVGTISVLIAFLQQKSYKLEESF